MLSKIRHESAEKQVLESYKLYLAPDYIISGYLCLFLTRSYNSFLQWPSCQNPHTHV